MYSCTELNCWHALRSDSNRSKCTKPRRYVPLNNSESHGSWHVCNNHVSWIVDLIIVAVVVLVVAFLLLCLRLLPRNVDDRDDE